MSVKVVQNICDDVKEFDNKEDFIKYYELNQNNLKDVSTCMLNKKFKINGYHIGRKQGELQLIPLNLYRPSAYKVNQEDNQIALKLDVMNCKIDTLNKNMNRIINQFNQLLQPYQSNQ
jgi:hypothetical protein